MVVSANCEQRGRARVASVHATRSEIIAIPKEINHLPSKNFSLSFHQFFSRFSELLFLRGENDVAYSFLFTFKTSVERKPLCEASFKKCLVSKQDVLLGGNITSVNCYFNKKRPRKK